MKDLTGYLSNHFIHANMSTVQRKSAMHSPELWWRMYNSTAPTCFLTMEPLALPLCFVCCHVLSLPYNYSLQGPSIQRDTAPLWWSGLAGACAAGQPECAVKSTSAGVTLLHFRMLVFFVFFYRTNCPVTFQPQTCKMKTESELDGCCTNLSLFITGSKKM